MAEAIRRTGRSEKIRTVESRNYLWAEAIPPGEHLTQELKRETWCPRSRRLDWTAIRPRPRRSMTLGQPLLAARLTLAMMIAHPRFCGSSRRIEGGDREERARKNIGLCAS